MPALIALQGQPNFLANRENSYRGTPGIAAATLRIRTLNTSPAHAAVQPAVSRARVELEGSTDLETWSVTTNRDFDVSRESRFFRVRMTFPEAQPERKRSPGPRRNLTQPSP